MRRCLKQNCLNNYVATSKPYQSPKNICARSQWTAEHSNWVDIDWDKVLFSDETSVTIGPKVLKNRVYCKANKRFDARNIASTFKYGYISVSVWGAFLTKGGLL